MGGKYVRLFPIVYFCWFLIHGICATVSVSITVPPAGRIIAGSVLVSATASAGAVGVQFKLDGQNLGSEITNSPFSMIWNTTSASNGPHTLTAVARDGEGNQGTATITITVDNTLPVPPPGAIPPVAPTLIYDFPGDGAKSWMSTNTSGELQVEHARIQGNPTSVTPFGVAIIGLRQNGVFVTEAGITATLPSLRGRCFVEMDGAVNTGLAISNTNNEDAIVSFDFTDRFGTSFGRRSITVSANQQLTRFVNQSPFNLNLTGAATFTFTSTVPIAVAALRSFSNDRNDFLFSASPLINLDIQNTAEQVVVPHFAVGGGWRSQIVLVNPTDVPISGDLHFFGQGTAGSVTPPLILSVDGVLNSTFHYSIAARSFQRMVADDAGGRTQVGSIRVVPAQNGIAPSTFATVSWIKDGRIVSEASISALRPAFSFRTYLQSSGTLGQIGSVESALAVANPSSTPVEAKLEVIGLDGVSTGMSTTITIPEGGQTARFVHEIFPQLSHSFKGVLTLKSTSPLIIAALHVTINERGDFIFTTTPPANEDTFTNPEVSFPLAVSGGGFDTQFVLLSISPEPTVSGSIWMLSSTGMPLD